MELGRYGGERDPGGTPQNNQVRGARSGLIAGEDRARQAMIAPVELGQLTGDGAQARTLQLEVRLDVVGQRQRGRGASAPRGLLHRSRDLASMQNACGRHQDRGTGADGEEQQRAESHHHAIIVDEPWVGGRARIGR